MKQFGKWWGVIDMDKIYAEDFNMFQADLNGEFVRVSEINKMIEYGAITIDRSKLEEYKFDTRVTYNKEKFSREEAMRLWAASR